MKTLSHSGQGAGSDSAVTVFSCDSTTGALTWVEFHKDGLGGADGLAFGMYVQK